MITTKTLTLLGIEPQPVTVRAEPSDKFEIRGVSEHAARDIKARVTAALKTLPGFELCYEPRACVTIETPTGYVGEAADLAVAVAVLGTAGVVDVTDAPTLIGELDFEGKIRPVRGLYTIVGTYFKGLNHRLIVPACQFDEANAAIWPDPPDPDSEILAANDLNQVVQWFKHQLPRVMGRKTQIAPLHRDDSYPWISAQVTEIGPVGSGTARGNAILLVGKPGTGKTVLARALASTLPHEPIAKSSILAIYSAAGLWSENIRVPFRAPHHTVSEAGLLGGGERPRPGEVSLAHGGCLLLDEVAEFRRGTLEQLARVVKEGQVTIARSRQVCRIPARPALVVGTCEPRDLERAKKMYPWTGVHEISVKSCTRRT